MACSCVAYTSHFSQFLTQADIKHYADISFNMESISFWDKVPRHNLITVIWTAVFGYKSADTLPYRLPVAGQPAEVVYTLLTASDADAVADFLQIHYLTGSAKEHPISIIRGTDLITKGVRTVYLQQSGNICGAISSLPLGNITRGSMTTSSAFNLRLIQNFCVAKHLRAKGIGSQLLHAIWNDTRSIQEDATIFLKEGAPLLNAGAPLYTSRWVYRRCHNLPSSSSCQQIPTCSPETSALIADFARSNNNPERILYNNPKKASNTILILYKGIRGQILSAFSSAKQIHPQTKGTIWYQTGWLEHGTILPTERQFAVNYIASKCSLITECEYIWLDNAIFCGYKPGAGWQLDGPFQYYAFHWSADIYNNANLFLRF